MAEYSSTERPIKPEWETYYKALEEIRLSGETNMWGAAPYLVDICDISYGLAREVLLSWIENYTELSVIYGWRN